MPATSRNMPARRRARRAGRARRALRALAPWALALALAACDSGPTEGGVPGGSAVAAVGGGQTARIGTAVATAPGVAVHGADGQPLAGIAVGFAVTAGGGAVERASATTDENGVASAGTWVLGDEPGPNVLTATVGRGRGASTVTITATARPPHWTLLVYLAADGPLALSALADIEEMESVAAHPEVQVVVQGEFSAEQFRLAGITAAQAGLPGFDTFRYRVQRGSVARPGLDGPVTAIGDRDLTDPAQLREFVAWGRSTHPAERTALLLWNRGGGTEGVAQDAASGAGHAMSLAELRAALQGTGTLDLLDLDMPLRGGYETLEAVKDLAHVVTVSEGDVPPEGIPYGLLLTGLAFQPSMDARTLGALLVDRVGAASGLGRASSTRSAYDLTGYPAFAQSLAALAAALQANLGALGAELPAAIAASQKFTVPVHTDLVDFLDTLRTRTTSAALLAAVDAARAQATAPAFRIATHARTGRGASARDVRRATGLSVVLPSGLGDDRLPADGPGSLAAYRQLHAGLPWTELLTAWTAAQAARPMVDQGEQSRLELYLRWHMPELTEPADIDLLIVEPGGDVYIPFMGTVTPNGRFTADLVGSPVGYEGYLTNRFVAPGTYNVVAMLWTDPSNARPGVELEYRADQRAPFVPMFAPDLPRLSLETSWLDDATFTWDEVFDGAYTDLRWLTSFDVLPTAAGARAPAAAARPARTPGALPPLTDPQLRAVRQALRERKGAVRQ